MPRPRKNSADNRLPPYTYLAKGRIVHRIYQGGKLREEIVIGPADMPTSEIWRAVEAIQRDGQPRRTLRWLCDQYLASPEHRGKAPATQRRYESHAAMICASPLTNGALFGDVDPNGITPGTIRKYLDRHAETPVTANRQIALLSVVFSWCYERDMVKSNPVKGVRKFSEHARTRYVQPQEYAIMYQAAQLYPYIPPIMELAYLCRMRLCEVLDLTRANLTEQGVHVRRRKGSRDNITAWNLRLRAAVDAALALPRKIRQLDPAKDHVIPSPDGGRLRESTVQTAWQRLYPIAEGMGLKERFTIHDLKAAGITDTEGDKMAAGGHKSAAMLPVYDRLPPVVEPTGK